MSALEDKLSRLPTSAGVYYHLDKNGQVIYVGKAANLRLRVRSYFRKTQSQNAKDLKLRQNIADVSWSITDNALSALLLESEMIKRYQPKYNVLERNTLGGSWLYVVLDFSPSHPRLILTREVEEHGQTAVLGPYLDVSALKRVLKYLRSSFPFSTHSKLPTRACLDYHLGLCPGPETAEFNSQQAQQNLKQLQACLRGRQASLIKKLKRQMAADSYAQKYERAAETRNQIKALENFKDSLVFGWLKSLNLSQDQALADLQKLFLLKSPPSRIEAYDISHIAGRHTTASMIVAQDGLISPPLNRRFKASLAGNDDFRQILNILSRRFKMSHLKEIKPDLILIDGGKPQVQAVLKALKACHQTDIPVIGLAKKKEELVFNKHFLSFDSRYLADLKGEVKASRNFIIVSLPPQAALLKFLQRMRDAAHRTALNYHNYLHKQSQTKSPILNLPSIGPATYKKLRRRFGSLDKLKTIPEKELAELLTVRQKEVLISYLQEDH